MAGARSSAALLLLSVALCGFASLANATCPYDKVVGDWEECGNTATYACCSNPDFCCQKGNDWYQQCVPILPAQNGRTCIADTIGEASPAATTTPAPTTPAATQAADVSTQSTDAIVLDTTTYNTVAVTLDVMTIVQGTGVGPFDVTKQAMLSNAFQAGLGQNPNPAISLPTTPGAVQITSAQTTVVREDPNWAQVNVKLTGQAASLQNLKDQVTYAVSNGAIKNWLNAMSGKAWTVTLFTTGASLPPATPGATPAPASVVAANSQSSTAVCHDKFGKWCMDGKSISSAGVKGIIAGGVIGLVAGLVATAAFVWFMIRRNRAAKDAVGAEPKAGEPQVPIHAVAIPGPNVPAPGQK